MAHLWLTLLIWFIEIACIVGIFYFIIKILVIMFTLSPLSKGDLPYVPVGNKPMKKAFSMLNVRKGDQMVDIGSGDGKFILYAARQVEATCVGIEINWFLHFLAVTKSKLTRTKGKAVFKHASFWNESFTQYNRVYLFNMPSVIRKLSERLVKELKDDALIVSVMFPVESPLLKLKSTDGSGKKTIYLYEKA